MTTTSWTTTEDIPPGPWAAMSADMRRLLTVTAMLPNTAVTGPDGTGQPQLDAGVIAFQVRSGQVTPLTVTFHRSAGTESVETHSPGTDGLVYAAVSRAARWWGPLLTVQSDADTKARAVGAHLVHRLFGDDDGQVSGVASLSVGSQVGQIIARAQTAVSGRADVDSLDLPGRLTAVISELIAERDGAAMASAMTTIPQQPAPVAATP